MLYEYKSKDGGKYIVHSPTPLTDKEHHELERCVCSISSENWTIFYTPFSESTLGTETIENAHLD